MRSANRELRSLLNSYQDQKLTQQQRLVLELVKKKRPSNFESFDNKQKLKKLKFAEAERVKVEGEFLLRLQRIGQSFRRINAQINVSVEAGRKFDAER